MELFDLDIGPICRKIEVDDATKRHMGYLPQMAKCVLGALNAERFCERMLRCSGTVLNEGDTLLKPKTTEKLTILRMNRDFMSFMYENYGQ